MKKHISTSLSQLLSKHCWLEYSNIQSQASDLHGSHVRIQDSFNNSKNSQPIPRGKE